MKPQKPLEIFSRRFAAAAVAALLLAGPTAFAAVDSSGATTSPRTGSNPDTPADTRTGSTRSSDAAGGMSSPNEASSDGTLARNDRQFIMRAIEDGQEVVALSQLAAQRAANPDVRNYASMVVADHTKADVDLATLAQKKGVTVPMVSDARPMHHGNSTGSASTGRTTADSTARGAPSSASSAESATPTPAPDNRGMPDSSETARKIAELEKKQGAEFDRAYVDLMADGHKEAVQLFQGAAKNCTDAEVKSFAATHLPTLQQHDAKAQELKRAVRAG